MHQPKALQRIVDVYFRDPARTTAVKAGTHVLSQDGYNDKLYWVKKGELSGYLNTDDDSEMTAKVFRVEQGMFFGVHSFFAQTLMASTTVIAEKDSELAWIDLETQPVEPETYGSLSEQFMPVMVHELARRQMLTGLQAIEKEKALQQLYAAEQMTTLGQLAAGIAHELNNAVGVLSSKTEGLQNGICRILDESKPHVSPFLDLGICTGQSATSAEVRQRAKQLQQDMGLGRDQARQLARALPEGEVPDFWLKNVDEALQYWDMGRDLHDMRLAAKHATSIVRSVKQLGGTDTARQPDVDVNDTIHKSLSLLQSNLRRVDVVLRPAILPPITASTTELVQVWVNIIKNACDAMEETEHPQIEIITRYSKNRLLITISNNGPMIDEATRRKVFQPNFTTKKGGLSFGLGLGLSIVQRIVHSYGGTIALKSDPEKTKFRIKLPIA
ncbi:ATP-binding protein [Photobacterium aphoticum]|uniref:histidine kinase n=2 Tax=Photobacterium aphoticum TaxID=754436 RepID=A0A0J1GUA6_9GAMM|nr:ATP-binding protein [Photobacterium aphoticum]KLV03014.1 histidine kinase [Photobacterium aphoticum]PSU57868.1 GHKL domain-containing protein [Photobacterium aphoticum]GHA60493.1 sensor histidine kinase [Photobacterium aphoticum]